MYMFENIQVICCNQTLDATIFYSPVFNPLRGEEWNSSTKVILIDITLFGIAG